MRRVTYSMGTSVDGYVEDADGRFDWSAPDDEVFAAHLEELRGTDVQLLGRRLHETMLYWETAEQEPGLSDDEREWARLWNSLPKIVFSTTLTEVHASNTRLATGSLAVEIARLRNEPGEGDIAVGGATLAAEAAELGLIDEYRPMIHPVLLGGGRPYYPPQAEHLTLDLVQVRQFDCGIVHLRHRVRR